MSDESLQDSEVAKKVPILELNDHCFLKVFEYFSLKECERFGQIPQLVHVASDSWARISNKKWIQTEQIATATFKWRVYNVLHLLVIMDVGYLKNEELKLIKKHQFPNITSFRAILDRTGNENGIRIITKTFPNLENLLLQCKGGDLDQIVAMPKLKELTLHFYESQIVDFEKMFTKMKLRKLEIGYDRFRMPHYFETDFEAISQNNSLEEISLNHAMLMLIANKLSNCPKLKQITCLYSNDLPENFFESLSEALQEERIVSVIASYVTMTNSTWNRLSQFQNLQKILVREKCHSVPTHRIKEDAIFRNLREIHIMASHNTFERPNYMLGNIWDKIFGAPKLEILTMPYDWFVDNIPMYWIAGVLKARKLRCKTIKQLKIQLSMFKDDFTNPKSRRFVQLMNEDFEDIVDLKCIIKDELILDIYQNSLFSYKFILD